MYGTSSSDEKLARVKELGLHHQINYKRHEYEEVVKNLTRGEGVDAVFEMLGGEEAALKSVGAGWSNIVQFTTYLVHSQDIPKFMKFRLREFPKMFSNGAYPPNTLLMIDRLVQEALLVEVQAVAAL